MLTEQMSRCHLMYPENDSVVYNPHCTHTHFINSLPHWKLEYLETALGRQIS